MGRGCQAEQVHVGVSRPCAHSALGGTTRRRGNVRVLVTVAMAMHRRSVTERPETTLRAVRQAKCGVAVVVM